MKKRILIVTENTIRSFTAKNVLKDKFNVNVYMLESKELYYDYKNSSSYQPDAIFSHKGKSILELISHFKKKNITRLNAEFLVISEQ